MKTVKNEYGISIKVCCASCVFKALDNGGLRICTNGRAKRQGVAVSLIADYPSKLRIDDIAKNTRNEIVPVKFGDDGKLTVV